MTVIHEYTEPFFHIGLLCRDVERIAALLDGRFGMSFHEPQRFELPTVDDGEPRTVEVTACYSKVGPPHIELFQADGRGVYSLAGADGDAVLHHVGVWVPGHE